ncbi:hypothetical protein J6590_025407 [Homalodisca vitripennis]|nr:hypothetical protein J6590_025407 [Homalodisca vitripennis]
MREKWSIVFTAPIATLLVDKSKEERKVELDANLSSITFSVSNKSGLPTRNKTQKNQVVSQPTHDKVDHSLTAECELQLMILVYITLHQNVCQDPEERSVLTANL